MTSKMIDPGKGRIFYGWFALAGVMIVIFMVSGSFYTSYGVFLPVICAKFGWSRAVVATGLSLGVVAFGLPSPLFGMMVTRFGPRFNIVLGNILAALGLAGMSLVQEVWHLYLLYMLVGLGAGMGGYIACTTVINNWFIKRRSLVLGMFAASGNLAGLIFPPVVTFLISSLGWRQSWLVLAGVVIVFAGLVGSLVLVRNRPEDMGQSPDGVSAQPTLVAGATEYRSGADEKHGWQMVRGLMVATTWMLAIFTAANAFILGTVTAHQIAFLQDSGFTPMSAAMTVSLVAGMSIIGNLTFGVLAMRLNIRYLASAGFVFNLIALSILLTTRNPTLIYIYAVLLGIGSGALVTALPTFVGTYYSRERYARVLGVLYPFQLVSLAIASAVSGAIYDATATYTPAFAIATAFGVAGFVCALLARRPGLPRTNG